MNRPVNFHQFVDKVCQENTEKKVLRYVIEKELLHYDILFALSEHGILDRLVFQGGTALRLCYKSNRYSEGLEIEIANIPAYTKQLMPIYANYDFLPDGYQDTFLYVESLEEVLADKIIAFVGRNYIKARDIWDIDWLSRQNVSTNRDLVNKKNIDYEISEFDEILQKGLNELEYSIQQKLFHDELSRFLEGEIVSRTLLKKGFLDYLSTNVKKVIGSVAE